MLQVQGGDKVMVSENMALSRNLCAPKLTRVLYLSEVQSYQRISSSTFLLIHRPITYPISYAPALMRVEIDFEANIVQEEQSGGRVIKLSEKRFREIISRLRKPGAKKAEPDILPPEIQEPPTQANQITEV
jgi:hypothetical protein